MAQEHERAAGSWQAEWPALSGALAYCGGAAASIRGVLAGLEVDTERMRANLESSGGRVLTESVSMALARRLGRGAAKDLVAAAAERADEASRPLREELIADSKVSELLSPEEIDRALDPDAYLGSAPAFIDRALAAWRESG